MRNGDEGSGGWGVGGEDGVEVVGGEVLEVVGGGREVVVVELVEGW